MLSLAVCVNKRGLIEWMYHWSICWAGDMCSVYSLFIRETTMAVLLFRGREIMNSDLYTSNRIDYSCGVRLMWSRSHCSYR